MLIFYSNNRAFIVILFQVSNFILLPYYHNNINDKFITIIINNSLNTIFTQKKYGINVFLC
jgi:hypothetical protein